MTDLTLLTPEQDAAENDFQEFSIQEVERSLVDRFEQQVQIQGARQAIVDGQVKLSYDQLNQAANRIAHAIMTRTGPGSHPVATLLGQGHEFISACWGIWKAGKISVPLGVGFVDSVYATKIEDAGARLIVCNDSTFEAARRVSPARENVLNLSQLDDTDTPGNLGLKIGPDDPGLIIYTSGSTGAPKGVVHDHRNMLWSVRCRGYRFNVVPRDRFTLLHAPIAISAQTSFARAHLFGASVYPYSVKKNLLDRLGPWLIRERLTFFHSIPTLYRHFMRTLDDSVVFPDIRYVWLGGEAVTRGDVELWRKHFSDDCLFANNLGATESMGVSHIVIHKGDRLDDAVVPVGRAYDGTTVSILDQDGRPAPPDTVGEIAVTSKYLMTGYWRDDALTRQKLFSGSGDNGERTFISGDLGRLDKDGILYHLGRKDTQVKIRGYRIETAAIEMAIKELAYVDDVAVVARKDQNGQMFLVAFMVPSGSQQIDTRQLRSQLEQSLAEYMVPGRFEVLEEMPLTATSKIDRQALAQLSPTETARTECVDDTQKRLREIFLEALPVSDLGTDDDFFELGGHSLAGAQIFDAIERDFGIGFPMAKLVEAPTIAKLADAIREHNKAAQTSSVVALQPEGDRPGIFIVPPAGSSAISLQSLARCMAREQPMYGFEPRGSDGVSRPHSRIEDMAAYHIADLRKKQPQGPYYIGGRCAGAIVAFEMVNQLVAQGQVVAMLFIIDGGLPPLLKDRRWIMSWLNERYRLTKYRIRRLFSANLKTSKAKLRPFHFKARIRYVPEIYPGKITLIQAIETRGARQGDEPGWEALTSQQLDVMIVNGAHRTLFKEPHVQELGAQLSQRLKELQASG